MPSYIIEVMTKPGPNVVGPLNTGEGDGARAVKEAVSKMGGVLESVKNVMAPLLKSRPCHFVVRTNETLDKETFKGTLVAVWNASKTERGEEPFPQTDEVIITRLKDEQYDPKDDEVSSDSASSDSE